MRETPGYYLLVWHSERTDHVWTETYTDPDDACAAYEDVLTAPVGPANEATRLVASLGLILVEGNPRFAAINMEHLTERWRQKSIEEQEARLAERRSFREGLI